MILPDHAIIKLCKHENKYRRLPALMIQPFNLCQLNPASYDVTIAGDIIREDGELKHETVIKISPGEFILACTIEIFNIPDDIVAQFALKSTIARMGIEHSMAGFCDPGWHGSALTMELKNNLQYSALNIPVGTVIGQMVFMRMESKPDKTYRQTGQYNDCRTVKGPGKTRVYK